MTAARDALAQGDLEGSIASSTAAAEMWSGAEAAGQGRAISLGLLALAVLVGVLTLVYMVRRRQVRARRAMAHRIATTD